MRGFSVIEIVLAMAIGVVIITAAIQSSFGEVSALTSSAQAAIVSEAASSILSEARSQARRDFNLVYSTSSTGALDIVTTADLHPDHVAKTVTARVSLAANPAVYAEYSTLVTNLENPEAPDTCDASVSGDWAHPVRSDTSLQALIGTTTGIYTVSDVDVLDHTLYLAIESTTYKTDPTLLIVDVTDPASPTTLSTLDNASTTSGISAIRIADRPDGRFIFGANAGSFAKGQLQVIDVSDPTHPAYPVTYKIPATYAPVAGNGASIFYRAGFVHLGLTTAAGVTEYDIIDVHDPLHPAWRGGYALGSTVERIQIKGERAYLATDDNSRELVRLDVSDPTAPYLLDTFNAAGSSGSGYGRSLFVRGTVAYLGRTWVLNAATPELYALDTSVSGAISALGTRDIGTSTNPLGVYGVIARGERLFVLAKKSSGGQLLVLDAPSTDIGAATVLATLDLAPGHGGVAFDCEDDVLYLVTLDSGGQGMLSIVRPS